MIEVYYDPILGCTGFKFSKPLGGHKSQREKDNDPININKRRKNE